MCRRCLGIDQELNAGLPLYKAPQPKLEASVVTIFLLEIIPNCTLGKTGKELSKGPQL